MGDRVWASLKLGGCLQTIEECEELLDALESDNLIDGKEDGMAVLKAAIKDKEPIKLEDFEVNYGTFDQTERLLQGTHGYTHLSCRVVFGRGYEFDAGSKTIHEGEVYNFADGDTIPRNKVLKALTEGGPEAVRELIERAHFLEHDCVPSLSGSDVVRAWLSILG